MEWPPLGGGGWRGRNSQSFLPSPWPAGLASQRAGPARDQVPSRSSREAASYLWGQVARWQSTPGRAVLGEVYTWKRTLGWVGGSLALSGSRSPAWHQGRGAVSSPPCRAWLRPHKREGPVFTHPLLRVTPLHGPHPLASVSRPAAMGREVGWLSKSGVRTGRALCKHQQCQSQGMCFWRKPSPVWFRRI